MLVGALFKKFGLFLNTSRINVLKIWVSWYTNESAFSHTKNCTDSYIFCASPQ
jgi:hypothetical protein